MKFHDVYYDVFAMKDGTVLFVLPVRKPGSGQRRKPKINEERICKWHLGIWSNFREMDDKNWIAVHTTVANCLNFKRLLRERVQSRLDSMEKRLDLVQQQLDRIESMMSQLVGADSSKKTE